MKYPTSQCKADQPTCVFLFFSHVHQKYPSKVSSHHVSEVDVKCRLGHCKCTQSETKVLWWASTAYEYILKIHCKQFLYLWFVIFHDVEHLHGWMKDSITSIVCKWFWNYALREYYFLSWTCAPHWCSVGWNVQLDFTVIKWVVLFVYKYVVPYLLYYPMTTCNEPHTNLLHPFPGNEPRPWCPQPGGQLTNWAKEKFLSHNLIKLTICRQEVGDRKPYTRGFSMVYYSRYTINV